MDKMIDKYIDVLETEMECVKRKSATNCTDCENCDIVMEDDIILSTYEAAISALKQYFSADKYELLLFMIVRNQVQSTGERLGKNDTEINMMALDTIMRLMDIAEFEGIYNIYESAKLIRLKYTDLNIEMPKRAHWRRGVWPQTDELKDIRYVCSNCCYPNSSADDICPNCHHVMDDIVRG